MVERIPQIKFEFLILNQLFGGPWCQLSEKGRLNHSLAGIHLKAFSQEMLKMSIFDMSLKITNLRL